MMGCGDSKDTGSADGQEQTATAAAAAAPPATGVAGRLFRDPSVALPRAAPKKPSDAATKKKDAGHVKNVFAKPLDVADDYRPPVHEKTQEERDFIQSALQKNFVFENMSQSELKPLIMAFEKSQVESGATIISQGDVGDYFYIIKEGTCSFSVDDKEVGDRKSVV